jgi:chitin disaccharide deacetylase
VRRLIINADDLGLTEGVNRGVAEAYARGVVTSTTLMANSPAFTSAIQLLSSVPNLSVGCHVVLIDGRPLRDPARVRTLMENESGFRDSLARFAFDALRGSIREEHIYDEAVAQFDKLKSAGITPTHFDTHKHVHMFPKVLRPLLKAARDSGIRAVRNPFVPLKPLAFAHLVRRPKLWTRYSEVAVLRRYREDFRRAVTDAGMISPDGSFGIVVTGVLDQNLFEAIIGCIPEGTWEFVCHPGYLDAELFETRTRLRKSREMELQVLTSQEAREALHRNGIELISYRQL